MAITNSISSEQFIRHTHRSISQTSEIILQLPIRDVSGGLDVLCHGDIGVTESFLHGLSPDVTHDIAVYHHGEAAPAVSSEHTGKGLAHPVVGGNHANQTAVDPLISQIGIRTRGRKQRDVLVGKVITQVDANWNRSQCKVK